MNFYRIVIISLIIFGILISRIYFEVNTFEIKDFILKSKKIPKGQRIKILHISDLHNKKFPNNNEKLLKEIKDQEPDIIVLTGDIIDGKTEGFDDVYNLLQALVSINKNTYFVSGNHEWRNAKKDLFIDGIKNIGIKVINNSNEALTQDNFSINVCGIDDPYTDHEDTDLAFNNINTDSFTILLSHSPDIVPKNNNLPCDLILCGHTHGGQIRFPFIGGVIAPGQGFFPKYDKGVYKLNSDTILFINSGLGTSGFPIRFLNKSQICFITLVGK